MKIHDQIKRYILSELLPDESSENLQGDTELFDSGVIDSLSLIKLVIFLEHTFKIKVSIQDMDKEHFGTIDLIAMYVESRGATQ